MSLDCRKALLVGIIAICGCWKGASLQKLTLDDVTEPTDVKDVRRYHMLDDRVEMARKYGPEALWLDWLPAPPGFEITPGTANFIFSSLLRNAWHFGATATGILYYDTDSYYVAGSWPEGSVAESAVPMLKSATRISGIDGRVFNRDSNTWERVGYVHLTHNEMFRLIEGCGLKEQVSATFGPPFETHINPHVFSGQKTQGFDHVEALEYFNKEGGFAVFIGDGHVTEAKTNWFIRQ